MPGVHLDQLLRYCGALTQVIGQQTFNVNNVKAAVENDIDSHGGLGALIAQYGNGSFFINNKKVIVGPGDKAAPDALGSIMHPFSPTDPAQGSNNFFIYDGKAGGGLSQILSGKLNIGEMLKMGQTVIGQVKNLMGGLQGGAGGAGAQGNLVMQNMGNYTPKAGDVLTGAETGGTIQIISFERSSAWDRANTAPDYTNTLTNALTDDFNVIAMPEYFTGLASQDYQTEFILVT